MRPAIRSGQLSDGQQLARLRWKSRSEAERGSEALESFTTRFLAWLREALASEQWHVAVAEASGELVGCMYLRCVDTVPVPGTATRAWGYVTHAFVVEEYRNQGTGEALLSRLIAVARTLGLIELQVWPSQGAITLYTRMGFLAPDAQRNGVSPDEPSYVLPLGAGVGET